MTARFQARIAGATAVVAGLVAAVVATLLLGSIRDRGLATIADPPALTELKRQLHDDPLNAAVKAQIRELDAGVRAGYLQRQRLLDSGRWVLLGAVLVAVAAGRAAVRLGSAVPHPGQADLSARAFWRQAWHAQDAVLLAVIAAGGAGFFSAWHVGGAGGTSRGAGAHSAAGAGKVPEAPVDEAVYARQWPRFRGPGGDGVAAATNVPVAWNGASGTGLAWSVDIPLPGLSSPVVWVDRVFLTGADKDRREVYAFDRATGRALWRTEIRAPGSDPTPPKVGDDTGYAAPTCATDGNRVYAIFANGDLAALDMTGRVVWAEALGPLASLYGHAASLATWRRWVIVQLDQGAAEEDKSRILAVDGATGRHMWETARPVPNSWATPVVGGPSASAQLITAANPWVMGYDPATGVERWRAEVLAQDVAPSPVWRDGTVYAVNEGACLAAIRAGGTGTVTATHVAWKAVDNLPDICSPLVTGARVYLLTSSGMLTCFEAAGGHKLWEHELGGSCQASPTLARGLVYVFLQDGTAVLVADAPEYREVARNSLGAEGCAASPAFVDGEILVRAKSRLFCVGARR